MTAPVIINPLSWERAVEFAIAAGRLCGIKQRVFKSRYYGWTYTEAG